jgi:hypothetical protein
VHAVANTRVSTVSGILFLLLVAAAIVFVACRDDQLPTDTVIIDQPPLEAKSDGADGGNPGFFFLPPIVPNPSQHENFDHDGFNAFVEPVVKICELALSSGTPDPETPCETDGGGNVVYAVEFDFEPGGVEVYPDEELYKVEWHTNEYGLNTSSFYRIFVLAPTSFDAQMELGFVDVNPVTSKDMKNARTGEVFALKDGRTLPIKFRIEADWLCDPASTTCAAAVVNASEGDTITAGTGDEVAFEPQEGGFPIEGGGTSEQITVTVDVCSEPDSLPLDLPQYGGCLEVTTEPPLDPQRPLPTPAIVAMCSAEHDPSIPNELATLHRWDDGQVYALPHAYYECGLASGNGAVLDDGSSGLMRFARAGWRALTSGFERVLAPTPLMANRLPVMHHGPAGPTTVFSKFRLAMPLAITMLPGLDGQVAEVGNPVPLDPAVHVTDLLGGDVQGALVHFELMTPGGVAMPYTVQTGSDGIARLNYWQLGDDVGVNLLRAYGRGFADEEHSGPRDRLDPFQPLDDEFDELEPGTIYDPVLLYDGDGQVVFSAAAVSQGDLCAGGDPSCTQQVINANQENTVSVDTDGDSNTPDDQVYFPIQPDGFPVAGGQGVEYVDYVIVTMKPCRDAEDNPIDIPVDIPVYGDCLDVTLSPPLATNSQLTNAAIVSMCGVGESEDPFELGDQKSLVTLHRYDEDGTYALPHAHDLCEPHGSAQPSGLMRYARLGLDALRGGAEMLLPPRLHATKPRVMMHHGPAGPTTVFSMFQMGMPVKLIPESPTDRTLPAGTQAVTTVRVLDLTDNPVRGATVHFDVTTGSLDQAFDVSDESGFASVTWTTAGDGIASAGGFGIATENSNGPRNEDDLFGPVDPFMPLDDVFDAIPPTDERLDQPVQLASGELTFEVTELLSAPILVSPEEGEIIEQNQADIGCGLLLGQETRGYGYQVVFDWTDVPGAVSYELYVKYAPAPIPIVNCGGEEMPQRCRELPLITSGYTYTACNAIAGDSDDWEWKVRALDAAGDPLGPWSESYYRAESCTLEDGSWCRPEGVVTSIDFDTDPSGAAITGGTVVNNVYSSLGVTFQTLNPAGCATGPEVYASSNSIPGDGSNAVSICPDGIMSDFPETWGQIEVALTQDAKLVCIEVAPTSAGGFGFLEALDVSGASINRVTSSPDSNERFCVGGVGIRSVRFAGDANLYARFDALTIHY